MDGSGGFKNIDGCLMNLAYESDFNNFWEVKLYHEECIAELAFYRNFYSRLFYVSEL